MRTRDAVSGDINLDDWQEHCVRTLTFQRLHRIKQLGNALHVYPSAMHTRFEHSLGACYQVGRLLLHPKFFPDDYRPDPTKMKLIKLAGLLHDIVHTPFRHTLDRDAAVLPKGDLVAEYRFRIEQLNLKDVIGDEGVQLLIGILSTKDPYDLDEPYLKQVIEDTISADLLDYSRRDAYFTTGWGRQWDERIYDHIAVSPVPTYNDRLCLVARITDDSGQKTQSAITELTNLLQIRYILNERVYFYPVKIAADSLLVKSVRVMLESGEIDAPGFLELTREMSDEELVNHLWKSEIPEVSYYAKRLKDRLLPAVAHSFQHTDNLTDQQKRNISDSCRGPDSLEQWTTCEKDIAQLAGIDARNIIVYCHDLEMQGKMPDFLVDDGLSVGPQHVSQYPGWKSDMRTIADKHRDLWRCYVFCIDRTPEAIGKVKDAASEVLENLKSVRG